MFLFITGAQKTATSRIALILNCYQNIFIAYEWNLTNGVVSNHGKKFLKHYPEARYLFRAYESLVSLYSQLDKFLQEKGYKFSIIGDKLPSISSERLDNLSDFKVIYTVRNIRSWLCKDDIQKYYLTDYDSVPTAVDYGIQFLRSFLLKNVLHLRMEDILKNNENTIDKIGAFIDVDFASQGYNWWENINNLNDHKLFKFDKWWQEKGHGTAALEFGNFDTVVELKPHSFWDHILPIFDRYYNQIDKKFSEEEIIDDISKLKSYIKFSPLPISKLYKKVQNIQLIKKDLPVRKRIKKKIKHMRRSLFTSN